MPTFNHSLFVAAAFLVTQLVACASSAIASDKYKVHFEAAFDPESERANVRVLVKQDDFYLRQLKLLPLDSRYTNFKVSDGALERRKGSLNTTWKLAGESAVLSYSVKLNHRRSADSGYDSRGQKRWALIRFEDLFPISGTVAKRGAQGKSDVTLTGPADWSFETRYGRMAKEPVAIDSENRRFARPTGWLIAGEIGVRRDRVAGTELVVAAPANSRYPRVPTLAFLNWTFPEFRRVFPARDSLLVVSGDDQMWRGALSGPDSIYLHPDRPLISENGTSTLLHEMVHVATRWQAEGNADWIVEGIAEFYSLELLRRSNGLSERRYANALQLLQQWSTDDGGQLVSPSSGANTAEAVITLAKLDEELKEVDPTGLDAVVKKLIPSDQTRSRISENTFILTVNAVLGRESKTLSKALAQRNL